MNEQTLPLGSTIPSEVRLFLAVVRRELSDLGPDEVAEMTDGLEADLSDLVSERGAEALGDPKAYAAELRAAAGVVQTSVTRTRRPVRESVAAFLDACHGWFDKQVERIPGDPQPVIAWLQPAWWIVRAWVAVSLVDLFLGSARYSGLGLIPSLMGFGWLVLGLAILVSVLIGVGRIWPGGARGLFARIVLLGLNLFAIAMAPLALAVAGDGGYQGEVWGEAYQQGLNDAGQQSSMEGQLVLDGRPVSNIFPYDAEGRRLAGVQLFDQQGRPLDVLAEPHCNGGEEVWRETQVSETGEWDGEQEVCFNSMNGGNDPGTVYYPWTNGQAQLKNVFPLAQREQEVLAPSATAFQEDDKPTLGEWPFATVPKVSLPGIVAGIIDAAKSAVESGAAPSATAGSKVIR